MSEEKPEKKTFDLQSFLLSIATAGTLASFGFLWGLNVTITELKANDAEQSRDADRMRQTVNEMQLDIRYLREQAIRNERQQAAHQETH